MKTKKIINLFLAAVFFWKAGTAQTGYIYVHLKNVNEQNSPNYSFVLSNSSGATVSTFSLSDQETSDNSSSSFNFLYVYDIGVSHGTGGDGQLWAIAGTSYNNPHSSGANGTVYTRTAGSSAWVATPVTTAVAIDGAYQNQFVYVNTSGNVVFYNNGSSNTIYTGTNATDVTANGGKIAIMAGGTIYVYGNTYSTGTAPASGGAWNSVVAATANSRLDMNLAANSIVFILAGTNTVKTVPAAASSTATTLPSPGVGVTSEGYVDVAYDDNGVIYATAKLGTSPNNYDGIASYNGSSWTQEVQSRFVYTVSGGVAKNVYGLPANTGGYPNSEAIWSRQTDNLGNVYWIDDDRVKNSPGLNGNGIFIPVIPGTYTLTETLPSNSYDLGRFNIYDPGGSSTGNVNTNIITYVVTAGEVVFGEYINEALVPKAIALTCTFQYLNTFDASTSSPIKTYTYGNGTYGTPVEGTSYHYWGNTTSSTNPNYTPDGYYIVEKTGSGWTNSSLTDHTGNSGFFLIVNASYAQDEFYRQRVTNLVPGLSYTISFWAADMSPTSTINPNVTYGLQDSLGNIVNSASTGNITNTAWANFSFTFTATSSTADLFLRNANIGGSGNDIGIDDISINPVLPTLTSTGNTTRECVGSDYTYGFSPSGGQWTSSNTSVVRINQNNGHATAVAAGSVILTYTYTNSIGCIVVGNDAVTVAAPAVVTATDKLGGVSCFNEKDSLYATIATASNPSSPTYIYAWSASPSPSAGLSTSTIQNTAATPTTGGSYTYTVTATDTTGCIASSSVIVAVSNNGAPTVSATANVTSAACATTVLSTLSGSVSGQLHPNYSYKWAGPGTIIPSSGSGQGNGSTFAATATAVNTSGQYTLTVTDANGCVGNATASAIIPSALGVTAGTYATALCNNTVDSLYSSSTGGTAPVTYAWSRSSGSGTVVYSPGNAFDTTGVTLSGATSGGTQNFTITAKDAKNCTASANISFAYKNVTGPSINASLWPTTTNCFNSIIYFPASVTSGSSTPNSYTWVASPSSTAGLYHTFLSTSSKDTAQPAAAGTYIFTLTVADPNGCEASAFSTQTVTPPLTIAVSANTNAFCGGTSGTASDQLFVQATGGNGSYTYAWGTPAVTVGGSSSYSSAVVYNPTVSILGAGASSTFKYPVTVTDGNGCVATGSTSVIPTSSSPSVTSVTATPSTSCATTSNAISLSAVFTGGTAGYSYAWTPPSNSVVAPSDGTTNTSPITATATAAAAQNYSFGFSITDANNCQASGATATVVTVHPSPAITAAASNNSVCANPATPINLTGSVISSTVSPYTYSWAGSGVVNANNTATTAVPATSGTYSITVTDGNGCTATGSTPAVTVDQAAPSISFNCGTNSNGTNYVQFNETNGTSWLWTTTNGSRFYTSNALNVTSDSTTSHLQAPFVDYLGTYTVQIKDASGCIGSSSYIISSTTCTSILAVSDLGFEVEQQGDEALLAWSTTGETNNSYFNVERSGDGTNWGSIGVVDGKGSSSILTAYSFTDALPLNGTNYYRLKQVNTDGSYSYSSVRTLAFSSQWLVKLYPNPVQDYLTLEFISNRGGKANIVIQSVQGSIVFAAEQQVAKGLNRTTLNQVQPLAQGAYLITVATADKIFRGKFIKSDN